jgi:hypothetical protein
MKFCFVVILFYSFLLFCGCNDDNSEPIVSIKDSVNLSSNSKSITIDSLNNKAKNIAVGELITFEKLEGKWKAAKSDDFLGLRFEKIDKNYECSWVLFMDCSLELRPEIKDNKVFLYGLEFSGGDFFQDFFPKQSLKNFNKGSLFCIINMKKRNSINVEYIDKKFINDLNLYVDGKLLEKLPQTLYKK